VHWGGDCACSWDGLAGSIRGGLHIGLSGFAFWSCDVPGFHSLPEFMNQRPDDLLYLRWTQAAIFMSHLRYHGTSAREPYAYPAVAPLVRSWLKLRYALIPYLLDQSEKAVASGFPLMRALILHHADDPVCWTVDDAFYCGESLLVAPLLNAAGRRRVYLPAGQWVDFWSGEILDGGRFLPEQTWPLHQIPVYARLGAEIRVYPHPVRGTDDMDLAQTETVRFDEAYPGFAATSLQRLTRLFPNKEM
ncbi:MAG: glycoside hydrolase family 31 protein, partial [Eubacteriales bacterium]|nr:glycoside hydrolase family 31 protein [Eubacteriales bacterium]